MKRLAGIEARCTTPVVTGPPLGIRSFHERHAMGVVVYVRFAQEVRRRRRVSDYEGELGTIEQRGSYFEARLERRLEHEPKNVWSMLTEPAKMVEWLAPGEIELRKGGAARLNFTDSGIVIDSKVTAFEPPRLLEYSWSGPGEPDRPVRWQVEPADGGSRLVLTLRVPGDEDVARSCAGWEAHLMMLLAAIEGVPIKFPFERFQATRKAYNEMLGR